MAQYLVAIQHPNNYDPSLEGDQLRLVQIQLRDARDYSVVRDRIALDFYRAAGVCEKAVAPTLDREQIAELNKYADTLPFFSTDCKEFKAAARMADECLEQREDPETFRRVTDQLRNHDFTVPTKEHTPSHTASSTDRSDRDSYSRGR